MKKKITAEIVFEIGHKAWKNIKPTIEGYTHDWSLFVRGINGNEIKHIVDKVIFHLPDSYPDPKQIKEKPPFVLSESTSQSFSIHIEIFLCAEAKLDRVRHIYDLFISDEEVSNLWERKLTFLNPSKEFTEKLLLAGGKVIDLTRTSEVNATFTKCKIEPDERTDIAKAITNVEALNADNLPALLKENEDLRNTVAKVKEKNERQQKLIDFYRKKFSTWEADSLNSNMVIQELKKKVEGYETEISTLKLQVQMLQNESSLLKNPSPKNAGEARGQKRKNKENLNKSAPVEKRRGNVIQPTKVISSPSKNDSVTSKSSSTLKDFSVSPKNQNVCQIFATKSSPSIIQNSSPSKIDTSLSALRNKSPENHFHSQSNDGMEPVNNSFQQNISGESNVGASDFPIIVSSVSLSTSINTFGKNPIRDNTFEDNAVQIKSEINNDSEEPVSGGLMDVNSSRHKPEIRNHIEPGRQKSVAIVASLNKPEIQNANFVKNANSIEVNSLCIPEAKINDGAKPMEVNPVTVNASLNKPEKRKRGAEGPVRINCGEKRLKGDSVEIIASLNKPKTKNIDDKRPVCESSEEINCLNVPETRNDDLKPMEVNPVTVNASLNKHKIRNSDIEEPLRINGAEKLLKGSSAVATASPNKPKTNNGDESSMEVNSSLYILETKITDSTKPVEVNPVTGDASLNKSEIRNSVIKESIKINGNEELSRETSDKADNTLIIPKIRKGGIKRLVRNSFSKKPKTRNSAEISRNKSEIKNVDNEEIVEGISMPLDEFEKKNYAAAKSTERNSSEAHISQSKLCNQPCNKNLVEEPVNTPVKKQVSSIKRRDIKSLNTNLTETSPTHSNLGDKFSSLAPSNTKFHRRVKNQRPRSSNAVRKEYNQNLNDISVPNLMEFLAVHYQKLAVELDRIENSNFSYFQTKTNPLFYKLGNVNAAISEKYFKRYICSLTDFFTNPKKPFDLATVVYLVVNYFSLSEVNHVNLPTYIQNQEVYMILPKSEKCIVSALFEVENKSIPDLHGLIRNILNVIHRVLISKKRMALRGLASLCRVFMDLCKRLNDRLEPLFLCCKSLRSGHPLAPYLINSIAGVWREPFYLHDEFSDEERVLLGSITYGMSIKPLSMEADLWRLTSRLSSTYFPFPISIDPDEAIQTLTDKIISRCNERLFEDIWMLTSPLIIFVSNKTWDWMMYFQNEFVLPNLLYFSSCSDEQAFDLFCNLYVDICIFCNESPVENLLQYFTNTALYKGVQDCAAVALLKYIVTTNGSIPALLKNWLLRNKRNSKLEVIADLYCKKVMESQDSLVLWNDVIIL